MKQEVYIAVISLVLVLAAAFFIFNFNGSLTGYVIYENISNISDGGNNYSIFYSGAVNRDMALKALNDSMQIILEMQENNFSIIYMNDTLMDANLIFKQAEYAEILRNGSSSDADQNEARKALFGVDFKNITYSSVLKYTTDIQNRKKEAFEIYDLITLNEISLKKYEVGGINMNDSKILLDQAKIAFYADRYSEAQNILVLTRESIDSKASEASLLSSLKKGLLNFFQRYWAYIILVVVLIVILSKIFYKKIKLYYLKKKISKLNYEKKTLEQLMIDTQNERFRDNKISGLVYNIRMKKYQEKLQQIKEDLPFLEKRAGLRAGVNLTYLVSK